MSLKLLSRSQTVRHFSTIDLPEDVRKLRETCRKFAERELRPIASTLDRESRFPKEQVKKLGELGVMALGAEGTALGLSVAVEEISRGCAATGAIVSIHNCLYLDFVNTVCTDDQKRAFLDGFRDGEIGCFALSEPDAGSDVGNISTLARRSTDPDDGSYVLTGTKSWVTSGPVGKAAVVFATVDRASAHKGIAAFLTPIPVQGLSLGPPVDKMGIRASPTCDLRLDGVRVPRERAAVGGAGNGFKLAMRQLDKARIGIASQAVGIASAALDVAVGYVRARRTFGKYLGEHQAVKMKISDMRERVESARLLTRRAAVAADRGRGRPYTVEAALAKIAASEAAVRVSHDALQLLGAVGYAKEAAAERHYRDARVTQIYGGAVDILKMVVGDATVKNYGDDDDGDCDQ